jgi:ATP synthase protein I
MVGRTVKNQQGLHGAYRLFAWQLSITMLLATVAILASGLTAAISALLGGLVSIVPNIYFALKLFRYQGARAAKQIVNSFYKGEAAKIALSVLMFALVFKFFTIIPLVFFAVYIVVQMVVWFAPLIFANKQNRPESD